jgi:DNA-binding MurR/RpiR family transcriptional regulator
LPNIRFKWSHALDVLNNQNALAEFERSLIRERTQAGLATARALLANPDIGVTQIAHRLDVSPSTLSRYIHRVNREYPRLKTALFARNGQGHGN